MKNVRDVLVDDMEVWQWKCLFMLVLVDDMGVWQWKCLFMLVLYHNLVFLAFWDKCG